MKFTNIIEVLITSINFIKSWTLVHRKFKEFFEDLYSDYEDVLLLLSGVIE